MNSYLVIEAKLETALDRRMPGDKTCWEDQGLGRSLFSSKKEHREDVRFWKLTTKYPVEHKYQATCYLLVGKIPWRRDQLPTPVFLGFHGGSDSKKSACNVGDLGSVPELGRSPWRRAWQPTPVFLRGEYPWTEDPGGLQSTGSQRVEHDWTTSTGKPWMGAV